jgi:putative addiction module killer protein
VEPKPRKIKNYIDEHGNEPFGKWISGLRDGDGRSRINVRIRRIEKYGNFGDCGPVGDGVHELVVDAGPGYRVYFGEDGDDLILLGGGDKSTQSSDIKKAKQRWSDFNA